MPEIYLSSRLIKLYIKEPKYWIFTSDKELYKLKHHEEFKKWRNCTRKKEKEDNVGEI